MNEHKFIFQSNVDPSNDQESTDFSLKIDYDLGWATVTGWTLYSDIDQNFLADGTSGAFNFFAAEANCNASLASLNVAGMTLPPPQFLGPTAPPPTFLGPYTPTTCDGYQ